MRCQPDLSFTPDSAYPVWNQFKTTFKILFFMGCVWGVLSCNKPTTTKNVTTVEDLLPLISNLYNKTIEGTTPLGFCSQTVFDSKLQPTQTHQSTPVNMMEETCFSSNGKNILWIENKQPSTSEKITLIIDLANKYVYTQDKQAPFVQYPLQQTFLTGYYESAKMTDALLKLVKKFPVKQTTATKYEMFLPSDQTDRKISIPLTKDRWQINSFSGYISFIDQTIATNVFFELIAVDDSTSGRVKIRHTLWLQDKVAPINLPQKFIPMPKLQSPIQDAKKLGLPIK